ncbi:hypothetical protein [Sphingomonas sp.]|jgi:hypothetical protein|uniref:hypothetical protein n=1 Tax=Sphingomonas sp. TaxID=28214 RepID=UPI002ED7D65C
MACDVSIELERGRIRADMSGFLSLSDVAAFARDEQEGAREIIRHKGYFDLLVQTPGAKAQGQDVMGAFQQLVVRSPLKARRIAIVAASPLLRMQIRRVLPNDHIKAFETVVEADAWLDDMSLAPQPA